MNSYHDSMLTRKQLWEFVWSAALLGSATVVSVGCGSDKPKAYEVRGHVVLKGKPLPYGTVTLFEPRGKLQGVAEIDADGNYRLQALPGMYRVGVCAHPGYENRAGSALYEEGNAPGAKPLPGPIVPEKYNHFASSPLSYEVTASAENTFDITLP